MRFEIFNATTGRTIRLQADEPCHATLAPGFDYLPLTGFWVTSMRGRFYGPFADRAAAERKADFENLANDYDAFRVVGGER